MRSPIKVLVVVFSVVMIHQVEANLKRECRRSSGVSWESLRRLKNGDLTRVDPQLKCYLKCFMVKNGIMKENNEIAIETTLRHLPRQLQTRSRESLEKCKNQRGTDTCDTAFKIAKCYFSAHPDILKRIPLV